MRRLRDARDTRDRRRPAQSSITSRPCRRATASTDSSGCSVPNKCATTIARVAGVIARSRLSRQTDKSAESISTGTGVRSWDSMILSMSGIVIAETSTSLPGGKSAAASSRSNPLRTDKQATAVSSSDQHASSFFAAAARSPAQAMAQRRRPNRTSQCQAAYGPTCAFPRRIPRRLSWIDRSSSEYRRNRGASQYFVPRTVPNRTSATSCPIAIRSDRSPRELP